VGFRLFAEKKREGQGQIEERETNAYLNGRKGLPHPPKQEEKGGEKTENVLEGGRKQNSTLLRKGRIPTFSEREGCDPIPTKRVAKEEGREKLSRPPLYEKKN